MAKKNIFQNLDDNKLQTFYDDGKLGFILKRGVLTFGGILFWGIFISVESYGDHPLNEDILVSMAISVVSGVIYESYLWQQVNIEYMRRFKLKDK